MDVSHIIDQLNKPQRDAVTAPPIPTLVLAGAGSGKTRVLVHRIAWLLQVENVSPFGILAVTFTNKAANEMRGRIESLLVNPIGGLWAGTFHSIAHRLLRRHWQEAKLPQTFQILDSDDQLRIVKRVMLALGLDKNKWPPRQAQWYINHQKDEGIRPQNIDDKGDLHEQQMIRIYTAYEKACKRAGVIDFAEMLLRSLELLRDNEDLLKHYHNRFRHILVDEFQDTNTLQYAWLRLLAGDQNIVFAVGDDDQSIYGWRGAKIENIQNFSQHFADTQIIRLEQNYRSTGNILHAANALIQNNDNRLGKNLWTEDGDGELIDLYAAYNESDEARYVISQIQQWVERGNNYAETAILYRSNAQSRIFEMILTEQGIPYRVYGGLRFFERAEIKDALCYLRLAANRNDDPSFERVINLPTRGIGAKTLDNIRQYSRSTGLSLWQSAKEMINSGQFTARAGNAVHGFMKLIDNMAVEINELPLHKQVDKIISLSLLKEHYKKKEKGEKGEARIENLNELVTAARNFTFEPDEEHADMDLLTAFLSHAVLESGESQGGAHEDCVQMMTLHSAKGLEFPLVFLTGVEENLFPHKMSLNDPNRLEEERRLCYVGITRARKKLVISYAESRHLHGEIKYNMPSQFIHEIPDEYFNEIRPSVTTFRPTRPVTHANNHFSNNNGTGLSIGQRVHHQKFGEGTIIDMEGNGNHARVQVNFDFEGTKWLVSSYAKLDMI